MTAEIRARRSAFAAAHGLAVDGWAPPTILTRDTADQVEPRRALGTAHG
ncbi:hypothetical protein GCM10010123_07800 [Pilimelia anulata]|uniref:Uncharacterized protein n=1 Tax=Pilimelia anulata TaxID=53371 RepID=A0A8J3B2F4_9ACTN|nr:hypothetical protein [Pilimelia anulata]GGJ80293.1 hypothetical protein GCM10010123_07800 [Pilimelia anulata]